MFHSGNLKRDRTRQLLNLVLSALLVLTTLVIIPSVANADADVIAESPPITDTTSTTVAEEPVAEEPVAADTTTTTAALEDATVTETTTTVTAGAPTDGQAAAPLITETTTTTVSAEPAAVETTTTTEAAPATTTTTTAPVAETTTTTEAVPTATTTTTTAAPVAVPTVEDVIFEQDPPVFKVTFVKRVCDTFGEIRSNQKTPGQFVEHAEPLGSPIGQLVVTAGVEDAAHPDCVPQAGWSFSLGTEIDTSSGPLSQVADPFGVGIITQASTPELDSLGDPTGNIIAGAVTITITQDQLDAAAQTRNGALSVSEGTTSVGGAVLPDGLDFGILRCGYDNKNGDNVEWLFFQPDAKRPATHITCYAYNVAEANPDFAIDKSITDIDGVPYVDGDVAKVGETINYSVSVTNTGNVDFTDIVIGDFGLDDPGLACTYPGDVDGSLPAGEAIECSGSYVATSGDALAGQHDNTATAQSGSFEIVREDDAIVPVRFNYQITFVKRVCESYDQVNANFNNPNNLVEAVAPLGIPVAWRTETVEAEQAITPCAPQAGWNFSLGTGFEAPADGDPIGTLSQVTGSFGTPIVTQETTPLLDRYGNPTGFDVPGAVTIDLTDEQVAAATDRTLWASEGLTGPSGAVLPDGFGFGILRCGSDNRNGDNAEFILFPNLRPGNGGGEGEQGFGFLGEDVDERRPETHQVCFAFNVELNPQIQVTKTVDKPEVIAKDTVEFTIDITNTGNVVLNDLTLDDVMTYGDTGIEDLAACEIPDATTLNPGDTTQAQCSVDLDSTTYGDGVLNTVTATASPVLGDDVSDSDDVAVTIIPPAPTFLNAACISDPILGFGFSLDQPLLEWSTADWGPTFDAANDTLELRIWTNDQDPATDAPAIVYQVPWDSDLLGQEPYASVVGAPAGDRIVVDAGQGYLYWPGYDNTGWTGPENGLAGIVYPGTEWRPAAYQFAFNPETAVTVVGYPPATVDCVPGGAISIDKLVGPLGTPAGSNDFVDEYNRAVDETDVTWQVTLKNLTDYSLFDIVFTDDFAPSCVTAFEASAQANDTGYFMTPQEELVITCNSAVGDGSATNTATASGVDLWGSPITEASDSAATFPALQITSIDDEPPPPPSDEPIVISADPVGSIGDTVWSDENSNGVQDSGEQGVSNATVRIALPDATTLDTVTDASGQYTFSDLPAGEYTVELIVNSIPKPQDGDIAVTTASAFTVQLAAGDIYIDADFGIVATLPKTGIDTDTLLLIALALMAVGGFAVLTTRRKRSDGMDIAA